MIHNFSEIFGNLFIILRWSQDHALVDFPPILFSFFIRCTFATYFYLGLFPFENKLICSKLAFITFWFLFPSPGRLMTMIAFIDSHYSFWVEELGDILQLCQIFFMLFFQACSTLAAHSQFVIFVILFIWRYCFFLMMVLPAASWFWGMASLLCIYAGIVLSGHFSFDLRCIVIFEKRSFWMKSLFGGRSNAKRLFYN